MIYNVNVPTFTGLPARVVRICVDNGDLVAVDSSLIEIETEMATVALPSTYAGMIVDICVIVGQTVNPGDTVVRVDDSTANA